MLANEEIVDGKSEVGGFPVEKRPLRQWMLRITAYAERFVAPLLRQMASEGKRFTVFDVDPDTAAEWAAAALRNAGVR